MNHRKLIYRILNLARILRFKAVFRALEQYVAGDVLDIGGRDFYPLVRQRPGIKFQRWTNVEAHLDNLQQIGDERYQVVAGDGCDLKFPNDSFDTAVNIQVLEHVFEPIKMVKEAARVLKPGGHAIFVAPQTGVLHEVPEHYYNFTKYWFIKAMSQAGLKIIKLKPLGGRWSTFASHLVYFFVQAFKVTGYSTKENKRNSWFYLLFPFMTIYAIISIPVCMLFSLGDLDEDPNNILVIVQKPSTHS